MNPCRAIIVAALALVFAGVAHAQSPASKPIESPEASEPDERPPARPRTTTEEPAQRSETELEQTKKSSKTPKKEEAGPKLPHESQQEYAACRLALTHLGTVYETKPSITDQDNPGCGIARPLHVTEILPGLELEGGAIMRCETARALGFWARDFLRPASAALPGAPRLTGLRIGTHYHCRPRNGTGKKQPKLSEHARGNAIDIAAFLFDGAPPLPVQPRKDSGDLNEAFQHAARASACLWFSTVLGPGSNAAHDNHLHLDVIERKNDWRLCQ